MGNCFVSLRGTVFAYGTFEVGAQNPLPSSGADGRGTVTASVLGVGTDRVGLLRVLRFGLVDGGRRDPGNTQLVPWASNGRIGYYGDHARPNTRYTLRVRMQTADGTMDVHVRAEGEEAWFPLAEAVQTENRVDEVCEVQLERSPDGPGVADLHVGNEPWPDGERARPAR